MPYPKLVAVVVTYNRLDQLRTTCAQLLAMSDADLGGIVVCDNASTDGTAAYLAGLTDPRLHVIRPKRNVGGAGGFARGMAAALDRFDPQWLVLMDDDARPAPDAFARFHATSRDDVSVWAAAVRYPSGRICDMNRPWRNPFKSVAAFGRSLWRGRDGFHLGPAAYDASAPREIDGASFVGLFVAAKAVRANGLPQEELFLYGDDVLYCLRLNAAGHRAMFDPSIRFEHDCETLDDAGILTPLWKVYFYHRNQVLVYRRAAGPVLFWPVLALRWLGWRMRAGRYGADKAAYLGLLRRAVADGLAGRLTTTREDLNEPAP